MGMESDHRTLARVLAPDVASQDGGAIEKLTGVQGVAEPVDPPNNNAYERTLCWTHIQQAVTALTPSADITAEAAGFDVSKSVSIRSCQSCPTRSEASFPSKASKQCVKDDQPLAAKSRAAKFNHKNEQGPRQRSERCPRCSCILSALRRSALRRAGRDFIPPKNSATTYLKQHQGPIIQADRNPAKNSISSGTGSEGYSWASNS